MNSLVEHIHKKSKQRCFTSVVTLLVTACMARALAAALPPSAVSPAAPCTAQLASPMLVTLGTVPARAVFDATCEHVYLTNSIQNRIEVFSLKTLTLEEPIQVGAQPVGLDVSLDGSRLYVANSGGNNLSVVDLSKRVESHKIPLPVDNPVNDRPYVIGIGANGKAVMMTFNGSAGGRVMSMDLGTEEIVARADGGFNGAANALGQIIPTLDRSGLVLAEGMTGGKLSMYAANVDGFSFEKPVPTMVDACPNATGSRLLTITFSSGSILFDSALNQLGTIPSVNGAKGCAIDPGGVGAYRSISSKIEILNLTTFLKTGEIFLPDFVSTIHADAGQIRLSGDGRLMVVTTVTGFALLQVQP